MNIRSRLPRYILFVLALAAALTAQEPPECRVSVWFSLLPKEAADSLYGKRVADRVSTWLASVAVADTCATSQVITEHDLSVAASGQNLQVVSIASASLIMASEQKKNGWRRAGSLMMDLAVFTAGLALTDTIMGPTGKKWLGLALPLLEPIGQRLIGVAPMTTENYLQLIEQRTLVLEPGQAGALHLFSGPYEGPATRHAEIVRK